MPERSKFSCIHPSATIAPDVEIGPFCQVGPSVVIGTGCKLLSHVVIAGRTTLGQRNIIYPNAVVGSVPQDKKHRGDPTRLEIGDDNQIREGVTISLGTITGIECTRVGNNNLLMANSHIGHDAQVGNDCVIANNVMMAGHVVCGNHVNIMGGAGMHHFVTVGDYAFIGGAARIHHDVPPFVKVDGADKVRGVNTVGLSRAGFPDADIAELEEAVRKLFSKRQPLACAMAEFDDESELNPRVRELFAFLRRRDLGKHGRYLEGLRNA